MDDDEDGWVKIVESCLPSKQQLTVVEPYGITERHFSAVGTFHFWLERPGVYGRNCYITITPDGLVHSVQGIYWICDLNEPDSLEDLKKFFHLRLFHLRLGIKEDKKGGKADDC